MDVGKEVKNSIDIDDYIGAFTVVSPTFEVYLPDGKAITCNRPVRYRELTQIQEMALEWFKELRSDYDRWTEDKNLAIRKDICEFIGSIMAPGEPFITLDEVIAAFFVRHFSASPVVTDFQAVKMIGAPSLLFSLYHQINKEVSSGQEIKEMQEVQTQKKDSKKTPGTRPKRPSVPKGDGTLTP